MDISVLLGFTCLIFAAIRGGIKGADGADYKEVWEKVASEAVDPNEWDPDLETWIPPQRLTKDFRYYIAGHDFDKRPVIIWEAGRWDARGIVEESKEAKENFYKYIKQFWFRVSNWTSSDPGAEPGIILIADMKDFAARQLSSTEVIRAQLFTARLADRVESNIYETFLINTDFVGQTYLNLIRPVSGRWLGRAEIYGTQREKWLPVLKRQIPQDQIPPWYGGSAADYKPVKLFG